MSESSTFNGTASVQRQIGFVGLGAMGSRLAGRLLDAGHTVYGTNRTRAKAEPLIERGMTWMDSPREVAARGLPCVADRRLHEPAGDMLRPVSRAPVGPR